MIAVEGDALLAVSLFAVDPHGLSGVALRSPAGPQRDELLAWLRAHLAESAPFMRLPLHATDDRLLGGLSLAATLREGRVVMEPGLLAQADQGVIVVAMAERMSAMATTHLCTSLDRGAFSLERDGAAALVSSRIGVVLLDEGIGDERAPLPLLERLPFWIDLNGLDPRVRLTVDDRAATKAQIEEARARLSRVTIEDGFVSTLCEAAFAVGVMSVRGSLLAVRAARAHAALSGRTEVTDEDAVVAARLVLGPRATRAPADADPADPTDEEPPPPPPSDEDESANAEPPPPPTDGEDESSRRPPSAPDAPLEDVVLAAAKSGIPAGLLDQIALGKSARVAPKNAGVSGALRASSQGGRPAGTRAKAPSGGERLNVVETLRAAAPWQRLRQRERLSRNAPPTKGRVLVHMEDLRVVHNEQRTESLVIFSVDASGSSALQRLSEAKGAVEQVLADCYVRRDHVALIAFRGSTSQLLLPPTRSLARARRCLAELAGGGGTPLASGIDAARTLALAAKQGGKTPLVVLMTDARANVALDGREGGPVALEDALAGARLFRESGVAALFLDTSPRPREQARHVAAAMGARYLHLPYLDATRISREVKVLAGS